MSDLTVLMKNWFSKRSSSASNTAVVWLELSSHPGQKTNISMENEHMDGVTQSDKKKKEEKKMIPKKKPSPTPVHTDFIRNG